MQNDRSTGHLFLRRSVLRQGGAGAHDRQLQHQHMKRRGLGRLAFKHAEPHQRQRPDEHRRHHGPAAPGGRGPPGGGVGDGHHHQDVPERQAIVSPLGTLRVARSGQPVVRGAIGLLPV